MAKAKTAYVCSECGGEHSKWQGQCAECGVWNTLAEIVLEPATKSAAGGTRRSGYAGASDATKVTSLASIGGVRHGFFTRRGGVSSGIYASLNCGPGSRDAAENVAKVIVEAMGGFDLRAPIVIRLDGTNAEEGRQILLDAGISADKLKSEPTMLDAARAAVALAK